MDCPVFERMIDYLDGRLAAPEASMIEEHLAGCASCGPVGEWYRQIKAVAARDESVEPPGWVLKRALKAFMTHREHHAAEVTHQMSAVLVFDSLYRPEIPGIRSTDVADRQLLYRAGGYSVDLQMARAGVSLVNLMGQILREGEQGFDSVFGLSLQLVRGGATTASAVTDSVGEFRIDGILRGEYDLYFEGRRRRIVIPGVPVSTTL